MTAEELWTALHDAATDYQRDVLDELAQVAGWRWRCEGQRRDNPERRARALDVIASHLAGFGRDVAQAARMGAADGVVAVLGPASVSLRPGAPLDR